jgi:hypothetical protein
MTFDKGMCCSKHGFFFKLSFNFKFGCDYHRSIDMSKWYICLLIQIDGYRLLLKFTSYSLGYAHLDPYKRKTRKTSFVRWDLNKFIQIGNIQKPSCGTTHHIFHVLVHLWLVLSYHRNYYHYPSEMDHQ